MRGMRNPYQIKNLGDNLPLDKSWKDQSEQFMQELIQAKFDQNPRLKEQLLDSPYRKYYEMTRDKLWATGRRINKADKVFTLDSLQSGKNCVGRAISKVKNRYILEEIRAGRREPEQEPSLEEKRIEESSEYSDTEYSTEDSPQP